MNRALALAVLAAMLFSSAVAQTTKWVGESVRPPRVGIFIAFEKDPSLSVIQAMEREADSVLAATGAQFSWLKVSDKSISETYDHLAVIRFSGACQMESSAAPSSSRRITLGSTDVSSGAAGSSGSVQCDQIRTCIAGVLETAGERDRQIAFPRALGRVVAHELFHILAHTTEHTSAGITKALQTPVDLIRDTFHIDRQAIAWLRQRLQSRKTTGGPFQPELKPDRRLKLARR